MKIINYIKCMIKGHVEDYKSQCPFTGLTYTYCKNCHNIYKASR